MSGKIKKIIGRKFNRWTVLKHTNNRSKSGEIFWLCKCDCGTIKEIVASNLVHERSKSCGCLRIEKITTHKQSKSITYNSWKSMKERCYYNKSKKYKDYGGRGIIVCERWRNSFENFLADMGERPEGKTIDRINNNGNYEPLNCKWSTYKEQGRNRRNNKLNESDLIEIRKMLNNNIKQIDIARMFNVRDSIISRINTGKRWD